MNKKIKKIEDKIISNKLIISIIKYYLHLNDIFEGTYYNKIFNELYIKKNNNYKDICILYHISMRTLYNYRLKFVNYYLKITK